MALVVGRDEGEQGRDLVEVQGVREEVDLGGLVFWWRRREEVSQRLEERERGREREREREGAREEKKQSKFTCCTSPASSLTLPIGV